MIKITLILLDGEVIPWYCHYESAIRVAIELMDWRVNNGLSDLPRAVRIDNQ